MADMVNHPSHYTKVGRKECIVEMEENYGAEAVALWCYLNVEKYCYRDGDKNGHPAKEDLAKAQWYFDYAENLAKKYGTPSFNLGARKKAKTTLENFKKKFSK